ncbi:nucleotide-binding alpha-beta plait domain-containing protein [Tanacetum coccineum]
MGRYTTKEDDVDRISTSVYVTNFPNNVSAKELFLACKQYGHVVDSYISVMKSKIRLKDSMQNMIRSKGPNGLEHRYKLVDKVNQILKIVCKHHQVSTPFDNISVKWTKSEKTGYGFKMEGSLADLGRNLGTHGRERRWKYHQDGTVENVLDIGVKFNFWNLQCAKLIPYRGHMRVRAKKLRRVNGRRLFATKDNGGHSVIKAIYGSHMEILRIFGCNGANYVG